MTSNMTSSTTSAGSKRPATAFRDAVLHELATIENPANRQLGENGMPELTNAGIGSSILALSQMVRGGDPTSLVDEVLTTGSTAEVADLVLLIFATRNTRGGKGEKKLAHDMFLRLASQYPETAAELLKLFSQYGYWKDLFLILATATEAAAESNKYEWLTKKVVAIVRDQLTKDRQAVEQHKKELRTALEEKELEVLRHKGPAISLLAKWMPREGSSLDKKTGFVKRISLDMWPVAPGSDKKAESFAKAQYRRAVAEITSYLTLPEVLLAAQKEEEIQFSKIASKATLRLRKTLLNESKHGGRRSEDPKRIRLAEQFNAYVLKKGLKGRQVMPHEIVSIILKKRHRMSEAEERLLDAQWKDLKSGMVAQIEAAAQESNGTRDWNPTRMVPMADVSGSMNGVPMEVSIALSLLLSEITHEAFRHMVLTFSTRPQWHRLNPGDSIVQKVLSLERANWDMSTNFEAAYDLILKTAKDAKLAREDLPTLIVFSDMQFDYAAGHSTMTTMHEHLTEKVRKVGESLGWKDTDPTPIVYWNLRNTGGHPVSKDTEGTVLLSGFSPSLLKHVMQGDVMREEEVEVVQADGRVVTKKIKVTPAEILRKMLDDKLYDSVREILSESREGKLLEYEITEAEQNELLAVAHGEPIGEEEDFAVI